MSEWLYQIRIKVSENISNDLRDMCQLNLSKKLKQIAKTHQMELVCTYDAFEAYCVEAERNGIDGYGLYHWTCLLYTSPSPRD